jgi:hypothetical protein
MIAKHVPMRSTRRSNFAELVDYVTDEQGKEVRLGDVTITNCESGEWLQAAVAEVLATQRLNTRAEGDKTYHLLISFPAGEEPSREVLREIEEMICAGIGFAGHQRISAVHRDTDNLHVHIAINKIHPERLTIHEPYRAYYQLSRLCEAAERKYGLQGDNHVRQRSTAEGRARDMEEHAGEQSLIGWIREELLGDLKNARSWAEFGATLAAHSLSIKRRGNGLVIVSGELGVKASSVAREFSREALETKFGPLPQSSVGRQAGETNSARGYEKRPVKDRAEVQGLWAEYQRQRNQGRTERHGRLKAIRGSQMRATEDVLRRNRLERATIKLLRMDSRAKRLLYKISSARRTKKLQNIRDAARRVRTELGGKKTLTWADWLRAQAEQGNAAALRTLRARGRSSAPAGNQLTGTPRTVPAPSKRAADGITKHGTIIYSAADGAIRDDGLKLTVSDGASEATLRAALIEAAGRFGRQLRIDGTEEFKTRLMAVAREARVPVTFVGMAKREETKHEREPNERRDGTERAERSGRAERRGVRSGHEVIGARTFGGDAGGAAETKTRAQAVPRVAGVGRRPPPEGRHRMRDLSALTVVRDTERSEVLLPGNVPGGVEHKGSDGDHALRRPSDRPRVSESERAAEKYIAERMAKRSFGFDIPNHIRYNATYAGELRFGGLRTIDGQQLALLESKQSVQVMPVDEPQARRLKSMRVGTAITIARDGAIKRTQVRKR